MFHFPRISDEEFVARTRKGIVFWDRFRICMLVVYLILLAALVWLFVRVMPAIDLIPADATLAWLGFASGATIGLLIGFLFCVSIWGTMKTLGGFRAERLMLQYYDRLNQPANVDRDDTLRHDFRGGIDWQKD